MQRSILLFALFILTLPFTAHQVMAMGTEEAQPLSTNILELVQLTHPQNRYKVISKEETTSFLTFTNQNYRIELEILHPIKKIPWKMSFQFYTPVGEWGALAQGLKRRPPLIVIIPNIYGVTLYETIIAEKFAREGIATIIPEINGEDGIFHKSFAAIDEVMVETTLVSRQAIAYAREKLYVNPDKIGLYGVSMGALQGTVLYLIEDHIKAGVLISAAGDFATILANTRQIELTEIREQWMRKMGLRDAQELANLLREKNLLDPFRLAPLKKKSGQNLLLYVIEEDHIIGTDQQLKLVRALGAPIHKTISSLVRYLPSDYMKSLNHFLSIMNNTFEWDSVVSFYKRRWRGPSNYWGQFH